MRVAVIGAGIVGASVAFRLARGGARVWLIDGGRPGGGTTSASFAWVNANQKLPRDYFDLNHAGLEEHLRLREELGGAPWLYPTGNLVWTTDKARQEGLEARVERLSSWGYAAEWRTAAEVNRYLEPNLKLSSPDLPIAYFPEEAWVDAPQLAGALVRLATDGGAEVRFGAAVDSIQTRAGRVSGVHLDGGESIPVDTVVNAAGPGADRIAALLDLPLPMAPSRGLLARLAVEGDPLGRLAHGDRVNLRPDGSGHLLAHHESVDQKLRDGTDDPQSLGEELLGRAREILPALRNARVIETRIGVRSIPEDGRSCVGIVSAVPGYYEAVTHSGVTLGPLIGELLTKEILTGEVDPLISPFRPDRFARATLDSASLTGEEQK